MSNEGVMRNVDALFGIEVGGGATSSPSSSSAQGMRMAAYSANDGTAVYKSITPPPPPSQPHHHPHMNGGQADEYHQQQQQPMMMMMKKKRGRPRKYSGGDAGVEGTDGSMSLALMPHAPPPPPLVTQPSAIAASSSSYAPPSTQTTNTTTTIGGGGEFSPAASGGAGGGSEGQQLPMFKKARGRPPGSTNKIKKNHPQQHPQQRPQLQPLPLGSPGVGFTPHVISVKAGEDVSSKIMSFSQNGPRAVWILSANGSISNVTLRQAATSGGTATYEGRFEILSLCGSFLLTEVAGQRSRTGGLSVSLAGPDGRVLGGCVAGLLTAASPIQVIVGSFIPDGKKELMKTVNHTAESTHNLSSLPMPMPMSMSMPPMLFSGGGGIYAAPPPTAGVNSGSPPSQDGGGGSFDDESSGQEEEEEEDGSPPDHGTGGTAATNNHHHINNGNPHAMLGMPWR